MKEQEEKIIICHYSELALKGKNRKFFEKQLATNIKEAIDDAKVFLPRGRVVVKSKKVDLEEKVKKIPGIEYFFFAQLVSSSLEEIRKRVLFLIKEKNFNTFRVTVKRADKLFPYKSTEVASFVGEDIVETTKKKVNLLNPEVTVFIEINKKETYIYFQKIKGVGGLPVNTSGRVISLISGGIDSPVASFRIIKRGSKTVFVHFHSYPATSKRSIEKVREVVKKLSSFQGISTLHLVPFNEIQKEVMIKTKESLRVLLYRRFMMRIVEEIRKKEKAKAIVTGESLGQVASQTIENIAVVEEVVSVPVLRPLIGFDKEEIISDAIYLKTYDISILKEEDCCVRFLPKHPETKGNIFDIKEEEKKLDVSELTKEAVQKTEKIEIFDNF